MFAAKKSKKKRKDRTMLSERKTGAGIFLCKSFIKGITAYIRKRLDIAKKATDLKQIYPLIFPQLRISVL